ncbi:MAG: hypothetical protein K0S76_1950 [Herbinix sp.]|nr:hypothetical protein [Herbinix sp.]
MLNDIWFHKYRIIKLLGRGGTANVYLAEHILLNSFRAIKFISKNYPQYEILRKEAQILKNLKHSSIPIIYDIEENDNGSYIVEEYLEGMTLQEYVEANGPLREDIMIPFILKLCDLILYLHSTQKPILYLDLKPENIIISDSDIKLIDFGSAVYRDATDNELLHFGTKGYAAPELYDKCGIDERCDVYGIGMLMYFMTTGKPVNPRVSYIDHIDDIRKCSKKIKAIISRCLKFHPSQRYASVLQLNRHLSALVQKNAIAMKSSQSIRIAVAGAQPRMGVTHLAFCLIGYLMNQNYPCLYKEENLSGCVWQVKSRYHIIPRENGLYRYRGMWMLPKELSNHADNLNYRVTVLDYGCLTVENRKDFLAAEIRILVMGAKDWELDQAEQVLDMVAEYKDILYVFNYLNGVQFHQVLKSMKGKNCLRMPYITDPFAKLPKKNGNDFFHELTQSVIL